MGGAALGHGGRWSPSSRRRHAASEEKSIPCMSTPASTGSPRGRRGHRRCARAWASRGQARWVAGGDACGERGYGACRTFAWRRRPRPVKVAAECWSRGFATLATLPRPSAAPHACGMFGARGRARWGIGRAREQLSGAMRATSRAQRTAEERRAERGWWSVGCLTPYLPSRVNPFPALITYG